MIKNALEIQWKKQYTLQESAVSTPLQSWLIHSGSFMQRLEEKGAVNPRVHVLSEKWDYAESWESQLLGVTNQTEVWIREVLIMSDKKYWMLARSVFPRDILMGAEAELMHLNTRPLGTYLFNHPDMKRTGFFYTCFCTGMPWHQKIINYLNLFTDTTGKTFTSLWSRYSQFYLQKKSLLLTEIFLPDMDSL